MVRLFLLTIIFLGMGTTVFGQTDTYKMLVGTYTRGTASEGIYALEFNKKGTLISQKLLAESDNPSFLALSPDSNFLYAVNETGKESFVSSFAFDKINQTLTPLNKVSVEGDPCYVTCIGKHVFTANYSAGTIAIFEKEENGSLSESAQIITHRRVNFGNNKYGPSNAHQILASPNGEYMMATNLGTNRVFSYKYDPNSSEVLNYIDEIGVQKGSGPRHLAFSNDGKFLYLVRELDAGISVFTVDNDGRLSLIQETTLVTDNEKKNGAADIHLSPDGEHLYATNRGEANTITCFKINKDGTLKFIAQYSTDGDGPRNFAITSDGMFIFVGNQRTNNITVFSRNLRNGKLKQIQNQQNMGAPVCLLLY